MYDPTVQKLIDEADRALAASSAVLLGRRTADFAASSADANLEEMNTRAYAIAHALPSTLARTPPEERQAVFSAALSEVVAIEEQIENAAAETSVASVLFMGKVLPTTHPANPDPAALNNHLRDLRAQVLPLANHRDVQQAASQLRSDYLRGRASKDDALQQAVTQVLGEVQQAINSKTGSGDLPTTGHGMANFGDGVQALRDLEAEIALNGQPFGAAKMSQDVVKKGRQAVTDAEKNRAVRRQIFANYCDAYRVKLQERV